MSNYTLIKCGKLFDGIREELQENVEIVVKDNKIEEVGKNLSIPNNVNVIDLSSVTVTPGLIDAHVHFQHFNWKERRNEIIFHNSSWKAMAFLFTARKSLHRGFTSIRTVGSSTYDAYGVVNAKKLINMGYFEGSRLVALPHYHYSPGSHGDHSQYLARIRRFGIDGKDRADDGCGVDFFRNSVREQVKYGADFVKIMATGGSSTPNDSPEDQQLKRRRNEGYHRHGT
ncbi:MAG: amidohydrolase family protein [Cloacibacillus evryensis]